MDRDGNIETEDGEMLQKELQRRGFIENNQEELNLQIPIEGHTAESIRNLIFMIHSKQYLLKRAVGTEVLHMSERLIERLSEEKDADMNRVMEIFEEEKVHCFGLEFVADKIVFNGFPMEAESTISFAELTCMMAERAKEMKWINPAETIEATVKDPAKVRDSWNEAFGGSRNSNKVAVLEEGMKYTPISISPEQAQFLETRKFQIDEIARIFRVPPHMVGDLEKSSFSNIEQQSLEFVKYTLEPWIVRWEQSINRVLLTESEKAAYFVKFNVDGLLRGDYQSRMNGYATARQNGWMSANDIRELENLDRIPAEQGGDLYLINGNMTKLEDAGIFAAGGGSGKEEESDEEVLEVEEPNGSESGDTGADTGEDAVPKRHHRRGKLV